VTFNGKSYICFGKPTKKGKRVPEDKIGVVVCRPEGTPGARILTDAEVQRVRDEAARRMYNGNVYREWKRQQAAARTERAKARQEERAAERAASLRRRQQSKQSKKKKIAGELEAERRARASTSE
jgi:hypothetical protein